MTFLEKLDAAVTRNNSLLCVGIDPSDSKLPAAVASGKTPYFDFAKAVIDATADLVCAFKPNSAFFEARGADGIRELKLTCDYIRQNYSHLPIILDFKRGDTESTNQPYASFAFDYLQVDAITVQPYMGREALQPYLDRQDKGIIVLCRTSNPGAGELQDLEADGQKLYMKVAGLVADSWNAAGNCLLVVGATYPQELAQIRQLVGDGMVFLVPGFGAQGGDAEATVKAGITAAGRGLIINSSRGILYASSGDDFAEAAAAAAREARDEINKYRGDNAA